MDLPQLPVDGVVRIRRKLVIDEILLAKVWEFPVVAVGCAVSIGRSLKASTQVKSLKDRPGVLIERLLMAVLDKLSQVWGQVAVVVVCCPPGGRVGHRPEPTICTRVALAE